VIRAWAEVAGAVELAIKDVHVRGGRDLLPLPVLACPRRLSARRPARVRARPAGGRGGGGGRRGAGTVRNARGVEGCMGCGAARHASQRGCGLVGATYCLVLRRPAVGPEAAGAVPLATLGSGRPHVCPRAPCPRCRRLRRRPSPERFLWHRSACARRPRKDRFPWMPCSPDSARVHAHTHTLQARTRLSRRALRQGLRRTVDADADPIADSWLRSSSTARRVPAPMTPLSLLSPPRRRVTRRLLATSVRLTAQILDAPLTWPWLSGPPAAARTNSRANSSTARRP